MSNSPVTVRLTGQLSGVKIAQVDSDSRSDDHDLRLMQVKLQSQEKLIAQLQHQTQVAQAQFLQAQQALVECVGQLQQLQQQIASQAEQQLVDLAVDIAQKFLCQEIQAERYDINPIVAEALEHLPVRQNVVVHLNPQDLAKCQLAQTKDDAVRFIADPGVAPAQCVLETPEGLVAHEVDMTLNDIRHALKRL